MVPLAVLAALVCQSISASARESAVKDGDRIVFVGDSITGQGALGGKSAWIGLIREGFDLARPQAKPVLTGLGGSGSTVGAWLNHEKNSRTKPVTLDVKETDVGRTLDAGAEIVVIMLGMNDVLSPTLKADTAEFDAWLTRYAELVEALRSRTHPRVLAVATVTPCTEDPESPKNLAIAEINQRIRKLADEKDLLVLPTNEASYEIQAIGRSWQPGFTVTGDFVHPNHAGHLAIAVGMLRGLGEQEAAARLLEQHAAGISARPDSLPVLSFKLLSAKGSPDDDAQRFTIEYQWTSKAGSAEPLVKANVPPGWKTTPESRTGAKGRFEVMGPLDHVENMITLTAASGGETREQRVVIPAGWRVAIGRGNGKGWVQNSTYDPAKDLQSSDETLPWGEGFTAPVIFAGGEPVPWRLHVADSSYTGRNRGGSIDFAADTFFTFNHQALGARWIYSDHDRPVGLNVSSQTFASTFSLKVWMNAQPVFAGRVKKEIVPTSLHRGWNLLFFRSNYIQWQWQFSLDLIGRDGDDLADLRYATKLPTASDR